MVDFRGEALFAYLLGSLPRELLRVELEEELHLVKLLGVRAGTPESLYGSFFLIAAHAGHEQQCGNERKYPHVVRTMRKGFLPEVWP